MANEADLNSTWAVENAKALYLATPRFHRKVSCYAGWGRGHCAGHKRSLGISRREGGWLTGWLAAAAERGGCRAAFVGLCASACSISCSAKQHHWQTGRAVTDSNQFCALPVQVWELVYILNVITAEKKCKPGAKGLVFAAGIESLVSRFAQLGCSIHATDFPTDATDKDNPWVQTNQHASLGLKKVRRASLFDNACTC